jgi:hypothetical protein
MSSQQSKNIASVHLDGNTDFPSLELWEMKSQNKYGTMYGFNKKRDLITTEFIGDYHVFHSENGKIFLCMTSNGHMGNAIRKMQESITRDKGFTFKPLKDKLYIRMSQEQANLMPTYQNMLISVNAYGAFLQGSTNLAFIQCELSGFKASARIDFTPITDDDNAVFP